MGYKSNSVFGSAFHDFSKGFVIHDATNEEQCGKAQEKMNLDKDNSS